MCQNTLSVASSNSKFYDAIRILDNNPKNHTYLVFNTDCNASLIALQE